MKVIPPYFIQQKPYTCSIAILRIVLSQHNIEISETRLLQQMSERYNQKSKNFQNKYIALLANFYQLKTKLLTNWDTITIETIEQLLIKETILMSVKLNKLYPNKKGLHAILIYDCDQENFIYHDPTYGASLTINKSKLFLSAKNVGDLVIFN